MRFAALRFLHPQDEHFELLLEDPHGVRRWSCDMPPLEGSAPLSEDCSASSRYLERTDGSYLGVGIWWRLAGGRCTVLRDGPDRFVVNPRDRATDSFTLRRRSKRAGVGSTWLLARERACSG